LRQVGAIGDGPATRSGQSVTAWQGTVSALRRHLTPYLAEGAAPSRVGGLLHQARVMIGEAAERVRMYQALQVERQANTLREVGTTLVTTFDVGEVMDVLADNLPRLGIPSAFLSLYEDPESPAEWSWLMLAYGQGGRAELAAGGQRFPSRQLVPEGMLPQERQYCMVVEPLYFRERQLGFAIFEVGSRDGSVYGVLHGQLSSALQGALLVQQVQERSAEVIRQKYVLDTFLDNVPDAVYFKDRASRVTRANQAHAARLGLDDPADEIGKTDFDFFPKQEEAQAKYEKEQKIVRTGIPLLNVEEQLTWPDGSVGWSLVTKMPLRDERGNIIGTFGISRDITELKLAQEALQRAYADVERQVEERTAELQREVAERLQAQEENVLLQQEVIEAQKRAIQELSTPIIPVMDRIIVVPLIGSIDTGRARDITRRLLAGIRNHQAAVVILDITGVPVVDSGVANHLNKTIRAARLKGVRAIITGISSAVAETIVDLGIDWSDIETLSDLQSGLRVALAYVGRRITRRR
jgi:rsbT co-antagonist protein RsbR